MEAHVILAPPADESALTVKEIFRQLELVGVTYGIIQQAIDDLVDQKQYDQRVKVAEGTPPEPASPGRLEILVP